MVSTGVSRALSCWSKIKPWQCGSGESKLDGWHENGMNSNFKENSQPLAREQCREIRDMFTYSCLAEASRFTPVNRTTKDGPWPAANRLTGSLASSMLRCSRGSAERWTKSKEGLPATAGCLRFGGSAASLLVHFGTFLRLRSSTGVEATVVLPRFASPTVSCTETWKCGELEICTTLLERVEVRRTFGARAFDLCPAHSER